MKTFKKLFSVSAIVALLGTLAPMYAFGANYSDELTEAYAYAYTNGITTMDSIDKADMYGNLTRIAMAKMMANYAINTLGLEPDTSLKCSFPDVSDALNAQYDNGVTKACQLGLMGQGIEKFNPNGIVTRAEFGTTLSRALNAGSDELAEMNKANPYYKEHLNFLKDEGIMTKIDTPFSTEVRGYVMLMMMRADEGYTPVEGCTAEELLACLVADDMDACIAECGNGSEPEEPEAGDAEVTVKKVGSTSTQEVPYYATSIKVGSIKLTAGDEDAKVSSIELSRDGLGDFNDYWDFDGDGDTDESQLFVTLRNDTLETDTVAFSVNKETAKVKFSPAITIKAGKSETFDVVVDVLAGYENATHNFKVTNVNVSNGTSAGLPVTLGTVKTTSASPKTVNVEIEDGDSAILVAGDTDKLLAKLNISFDKSAGTLDRFSLVDTEELTKLGDAFTNVYAYVDGKKVGNVYVSDEKIVVSNLNISMDKDDEVSIEVRGDVTYEEKTTTFLFEISSLDITNNGYGLMPDTSSSMAQTNTINVGGNDVDFTKVALTEKEFLPGKTNITVFNAKFKPAIDVKITDATITCSDTLSADVLKSESAQLLVDGDEFDLADAAVIAGSISLTNMKVDVDANSSINVKMILSTKKPLSGDPVVDEAIQCSVVLKGNGIEDTTNTFTSRSVKSEKVSVKEGFATVSNAVNQGPVTRSLFSDAEQEAGRFSIEAEGDSITLNELVLKYATSIGDTDDVEALLDTMTLVDVDTDDEIQADFDIDTLAKTVTIKNIKNYTINKDKTVDLKVMLNLGDISDFYGDTLSFELDSTEVKSSIRTLEESSIAQDLSDVDYTFRMTAPSITMTKMSENKFKVVIKNSDKDNAVYVDTLRYRVRATADDSTFAGKVCIADDANVIECDDTADHVLDVDTFGIRTDGLKAKVSINANQSKTYYIVVDGTSIEPEVLQADISKLSYDNTTTTAPENYSVSAK